MIIVTLVFIRLTVFRKPKLIVTVDTECSAGGWPQNKYAEPLGYDSMMICKIGAKEYGIRHIMDVMESYSLVADFFVEPLCSYKLGISQLKDICQEVINRGHGISLHLHPRWKLALYPGMQKLSDCMYDYSVDEQEQLVSAGLDILSECGVKGVNAFRAGNLSGNTATYEAMRKAGISISSNFCGAWNEEMPTRFGLPRVVNDATIVKGAIEIPVTSFHDFPHLRPGHLRPLQVSAASRSEFRNVINAAIDKQLRFVVVLLHTFEWIRQGPNKTQGVDSHIMKRFHSLCATLSNYRDKIEVCRFKDIDPVGLYSDLEFEGQAKDTSLMSSDIDGFSRWIQHAVRKIVNFN